jgi:integrase
MPKASYPEPFVPSRFTCAVRRTTTELTTVDRATGERRTTTAPRWDVKGRANGIEYAKRFSRAGLAESWKRRLDEGFAAGLPFDLAAKQFVRPADTERVPPEPTRRAPTVLEVTEAFYRSHPEWEPNTKILAATALNRGRRWFLARGSELGGRDLCAVEDFLGSAAFRRDEAELTDRQAAGLEWLRRNSAAFADVTTADVEAFLARFAVNQRNGKKVSRTTMIRYAQPLRACWAWAVARADIPVERNPWLAVRPPRKVKGRSGRPSAGPGRLAVDEDIVLSVEQAVELADRCVTAGRWGEVVRCYVLVMALCGLRPSEAVGITWDDVELPDEGVGWLTVRRSRRRIAAHWLDADEDPEWGPLKDRDIADTRRVPIHPFLVTRLRQHREAIEGGPGSLVFHRGGRPFDLSVFSRDVWEPARAELFPARSDLPPDDPRQPKLSRLRRHDLRHAACSWWLRSGVDAMVCQRWSGHKSLSVFLDVYQGVAPGREAEGVRKLIDSFPP